MISTCFVLGRSSAVSQTSPWAGQKASWKQPFISLKARVSILSINCFRLFSSSFAHFLQKGAASPLDRAPRTASRRSSTASARRFLTRKPAATSRSRVVSSFSAMASSRSKAKARRQARSAAGRSLRSSACARRVCPRANVSSEAMQASASLRASSNFPSLT